MSVFNFDIDTLVSAIHASTASMGKKFSFGVTGGGSTALGYLMAQPGASSTVLEFTCTYACESTQEYVNHDSTKPLLITSFAALETAKELANASLRRSKKIMTTQSPDLAHLSSLVGAVGIGATASLASKNWKRGDHRIFASLVTNDKEITFSLNLFKGVEAAPFRTRKQEDDLSGKLIVCITAFECGLLDSTSLVEFLLANGLDEKDTLLISEVHIKNSLEYLLDSDVNNVLLIPQHDGTSLKIADVPIHLLGQYAPVKPKVVMLPGSFNPLHAGHTTALTSSLELCDPATNPQGLFELSVFNVDKPPLKMLDLITRLEHFTGTFPVFLTNTPRFVDKSRVYPGISYVLGVDTVVRLVDPDYTNGSVEKMILLLKDIIDKGTEFFVLPRTFGTSNIAPSFRVQLNDDELLTYSLIKDYVPYVLRPAFKEIMTNVHKDLSSSALRNSFRMGLAKSSLIGAAKNV